MWLTVSAQRKTSELLATHDWNLMTQLYRKAEFKEKFYCTSLKQQRTKTTILFVQACTRNLKVVETLTRRTELSTGSRSEGVLIIFVRFSFPSKFCWGKLRAHCFITLSSQIGHREAYSSSSPPWIQHASRDSSRKKIKAWKQLTPRQILSDSLLFYDWPQNEVVKMKLWF